jgi:hypothetical protein
MFSYLLYISVLVRYSMFSLCFGLQILKIRRSENKDLTSDLIRRETSYLYRCMMGERKNAKSMLI